MWAPKVGVQTWCSMSLSTICNLPACSADCLQLKNGFGSCIPKPNESSHACICFYSC
ncbi:hypothetical protein MA16_Dca027634 [Dendrobium catenatum]|uniref:Uncharacterized protein n=1 Tax=Dendrobium catenatum TaxID=906689 RepID=A0A2I0VEZ2_9ASPA|nr:hypothetical protein MA16_Dca027634 [Dendrobium catenatum]